MPHSTKRKRNALEGEMTRDEQNEKIREMWANGKSASQIAKVVGLTRNGVIGRVHRLGLSTTQRNG